MYNSPRRHWLEVYQSAMLELENALLEGRIFEARNEIAKRLAELRQLPGLHLEERQSLDDARQGLLCLEREDRRHKTAAVGRAALAQVSALYPPRSLSSKSGSA